MSKTLERTEQKQSYRVPALEKGLEVLELLSGISQPLSLTDIADPAAAAEKIIAAGGDAIAVEGRTLEPSIVPEYLRRLGTEDGFASRKFRTFELERSEGSEPGLAFKIATLSEAMKSDGDRE